MNAKMLTIAAFTGLVALSSVSAQAAERRVTARTPTYNAQVVEGRNVSVYNPSAANEDAAIRAQVEGNARSSH